MLHGGQFGITARNPEMQLKLLQCSLDLHISYGHKYVHMPGLTLVLLLIFFHPPDISFLHVCLGELYFFALIVHFC